MRKYNSMPVNLVLLDLIESFHEEMNKRFSDDYTGSLWLGLVKNALNELTELKKSFNGASRSFSSQTPHEKQILLENTYLLIDVIRFSSFPTLFKMPGRTSGNAEALKYLCQELDNNASERHYSITHFLETEEIDKSVLFIAEDFVDFLDKTRRISEDIRKCGAYALDTRLNSVERIFYRQDYIKLKEVYPVKLKSLLPAEENSSNCCFPAEIENLLSVKDRVIDDRMPGFSKIKDFADKADKAGLKRDYIVGQLSSMLSNKREYIDIYHYADNRSYIFYDNVVVNVEFSGKMIKLIEYYKVDEDEKAELLCTLAVPDGLSHEPLPFDVQLPSQSPSQLPSDDNSAPDADASARGARSDNADYHRVKQAINASILLFRTILAYGKALTTIPDPIKTVSGLVKSVFSDAFLNEIRGFSAVNEARRGSSSPGLFGSRCDTDTVQAATTEKNIKK